MSATESKTQPARGSPSRERWSTLRRGGGYPVAESGLAQIALKWMVEEAEAKDLYVDFNRKKEVLGQLVGKYARTNYDTKAHESLKGASWRRSSPSVAIIGTPKSGATARTFASPSHPATVACSRIGVFALRPLQRAATR